MRLLAAITFFLLGAFCSAQAVQVPSINIGLGNGQNQNDIATSLQLLAMLTVLSVAPALMILTTAFTRIVIVFSLLRTALGTQSIPPNQVIIGLSLFLTFFVMAPTYNAINTDAIGPYMNKQITFDQALKKAEAPAKKFMLRNTYKKDLEMFLAFRGEKAVSQEDVSFITLTPAFVVSELKTAFLIGFYLFIPFVVIDLIIASVLMSMGMMMMPPTVVSLPAKILIFVLADGWSVIVKSVLAGYA